MWSQDTSSLRFYPPIPLGSLRIARIQAPPLLLRYSNNLLLTDSRIPSSTAPLHLAKSLLFGWGAYLIHRPSSGFGQTPPPSRGQPESPSGACSAPALQHTPGGGVHIKLPTDLQTRHYCHRPGGWRLSWETPPPPRLLYTFCHSLKGRGNLIPTFGKGGGEMPHGDPYK